MTTSDDQPRPADDLAATTHADPLADPLAGQGQDEGAAPITASVDPADRSLGRLLLAVLAALAAAALGIAVWSYFYIEREREYVGASVVIALAAGWLLRVVSGRSTWPVRILAVLITAVACVLGTLTAELAFNADRLGVGISELAPDYEWQAALKSRGWRTWGIFAAAVVLAYLSAMPQKPSKKKAAAAAAAAAASDGGYDADSDSTDPGSTGYDAAPDDEGRGDDSPPPPRMPAG